MQELRLVGVHEDGRHLLLADDQGARFQVSVDDALRAAVRHTPSSTRGSGEATADVGPREVQALIRAGLTTEEAAERSGWTVEKVRRYEVPILAEREYVTGLARLVRLRHRGSAAQPTLATRVTERLRTRGVDADNVRWDSVRPPGSQWSVAVTFAAGGRQRRATWTFDPVTRVLHAEDDEARWLTEDEPSTAGLLGREVPVYDVEADGGVHVPSPPAPSPPASATAPSVPVDLVTAMRQRTSARTRGGARRRADAALPTTDQDSLPVPQHAAGALPANPAERPPAPHDPVANPAVDDPVPGRPETSAPADSGRPPDHPEPQDAAQTGAIDVRDDAASEPEPAQPAPRRVRSRRPARTPVPAWKDVMLGTKPASD